MLDLSDGREYDAKQVRVDLSLPAKDIGPLKFEADKAGRGHYVVPAAAFGSAGDWQVRLSARVSKGERYE